MTLAAPQVPIRVDPETGIWTTDGLPMIYLPRHYYVNHIDAFEAAFGRDAVKAVLYEAGYRSAWQWCEKEAATHGLGGLDVFRHYMKRLSQRGWGRFTIEALNEASGEAVIRVDHSIYVCHHGHDARRRLCYPFAGWFPGAIEWAGRDLGLSWTLTSEEVCCAGEGSDHCRFEVRPRALGTVVGPETEPRS